LRELGSDDDGDRVLPADAEIQDADAKYEQALQDDDQEAARVNWRF